MRRRILPLTLLAALACTTPDVAPGLDQFTCDGGLCADPGVINGSLAYAGPMRGDAVLLLFDTAALPPPQGNGTQPAAIARIPASTLFAGAAPGSVGPFSAPFTFTQVPSGRSYQIQAFLDVSGEFNPFFDYTQQPRAGAPAGGHGALDASGQPVLVSVDVPAGVAVNGINVALTTTVPYDPPSFEIAGGSQTIDVSIDRPAPMTLNIRKVYPSSHFALEYDLDASGNRKSTFGGLDDVFPRVLLRQTGVPADQAAIVPCQTISTPVLPAIAALQPGQPPPALDTLHVLVQPFAVKAADLSPLPSIPKGAYQVVVVEKTGQFWTLPNSLSAQDATQAQTVTFDSHLSVPANSVSGNVVFSGDPSQKSGNIVVQAYADLPYAPPPPNGAALPVRLAIIPAARVTKTADGFTAPYTISGLPAGKYVVQALDDVDGNFSTLNLLQTPTNGDLVGAVVDATLRPVSITVSGNVTGQNVVLGQKIPVDPPAFVVASPAQMPADQVTPVRFDLRAQPTSFPAGQVAAPHFVVELVRDSGGAVVDADQDGLPDVWPKVFLVRLDPSDPRGLTQYVSPDTHQTATQVIPAAVDPTPFLAALTPLSAAPVVTDHITVIARPALLDATDPTQPPRKLASLQPGSYKIVLLERTGQVWQIPNESGSAALDPSVVCTTATCAPGTVKTQSQSQALQVGLPAHTVYSGAIAGTLSATTPPAAAYVFAYATNALPPFGQPVSADFHVKAEFVGAGSVAYQLPDLASGSYVVFAVADTRGDFSSPSYLALSPGAGTLLTAQQVVSVGTGVTPLNLTASTSAPPRPSFAVTDAGGTPLTNDANVTAGSTMHIAPQLVLTSKVAPLHGDTSTSFVLGCSSGVPDATTLSVELLKVADAAGLTPDLDAQGRGTVVQATVDQTQLNGVSCGSSPVIPWTGPLLVNVGSGSAKVNLLDPNAPVTPVALVPGRYAIAVTSLAKQVWRLPNELQPLLQDPAAYAATPADVKTVLQTQQVAVNIAP